MEKLRKLSSAKTSHGLVFIFLIAQQIIGFVFDPYKFVSPYWIAVTLFTIYLANELRIRITKENVLPFILFALCAIGSLANILVGSQVAYAFFKIYYSFLGLVGLLYITKFKINTHVFIPFILILHVYFYIKYFQYDEGTRLMLDENLFVQSSSNTIAMALNIVLIVYLMVSKAQKENHKWFYLGIALLNLYWISIQGSRAGILVAFLLVVYTLLNVFGGEQKFKFRFIISAILIAFLLLYFRIYLFNYAEDRSMAGVEAYEENVRYFAQSSFFSSLNIEHFILGYPRDFSFIGDQTRTYNSFLDFWARYGFLPFLFMFFCLFRRFIYQERFSISFLILIPLLAYTPFESLWGGTLWDILLYIVLFYSYNSSISVRNQQCKKQQKIISYDRFRYEI